MATEKKLEHMKLVPWAGVAARLSPPPEPPAMDEDMDDDDGEDAENDTGDDGFDRKDEDDGRKKTNASIRTGGGAAYCFLPLPVWTRLPVHVNGYFELSSNRRDIWWSADDMAGDGRARAVWNASLLADVAGPCYCRLMAGAARTWDDCKEGDEDARAGASRYEALFPVSTDRLAGPWKLLAHRFYSGIRDLPVLRSLSSQLEKGQWVAPSASVVLADEEGDDGELLAQILRAEGLPLVTFRTPGMRKTLVDRSACQTIATPRYVRCHFRGRRAGMNGALEVAGERRAYAEYLLRYCSSDLDASRYAAELTGCQFVPLADGSLGTFRAVSRVNPEVLSQLRTMGFTRLTFLGAVLEAKGNVDAAVEALFARKFDGGRGGGGGPALPSATSCARGDDGRESPRMYLICAGDGAALLRGRADGAFVDLDAMKDDAARAVLVRAADSDSSPSLNVAALGPELLADAVEMSVPREWHGVESGSAPWSRVVDGGGVGEEVELVEAESRLNYGPDKEWFRLLFRYVCGSDDAAGCLDAVAAGSYCVVPTGQGVVCTLSSGSAVVDPTGLDSPMIEALESLGVRSLLPEILPRDIIVPQELWSYVNKPSRDGVVRALVAAMQREEGVTAGVTSPFDVASDSVRKRLYDFFRDGANGVLSDSSRNALRNFPIFSTYLDECHAGTQFVAPVRGGVWYAMESGMSSDPTDQALMTSEFLAFSGSPELVFLSSVLRVTRLSRAQFYRRFVLPQVGDLEEGVRSAVAERILIDMPSLCASDPTFRDALVATKFVPSAVTKTLSSPRELYDPEVPQLRALMSEDAFPHESHCSRKLLLSLKDLGLQSSMSWDVILDCARSIERDGTQTDDEHKRKMAAVRGSQLLAFLDTNVARYFPDLMPKEESKTSSFLRRGYAALFEDSEKKKADDALQKDLVHTLLSIQWMPVRTAPLHPLLPWPSDPAPVSSPLQTCTRENAWLVSYNRRLVDFDVHSNELKKLFGWFDAVTIEDVAKQLKMLGIRFHEMATKAESQGEQASSAAEGAINALRQTITSEVPRIYNVLNGVKSDYDANKIKSTLFGCDWLWMGDKFVPADHVAYSSPINATPYLYTVPPDLACFRNLLNIFGIRSTFRSSDYCLVLQRMAIEGSENETGRRNLEWVDLAVSLVQGLSDDVAKLGDMEIYAPSESGKIMAASEMTYDDAPWLSKDMQSKRETIFCHPKLSAAVASKIGAKSLRQSLVKDNAVVISFGDGVVRGAEAFGQSESLTRRLKNIIELYPEGPQQLSELIQNADDAKASVVKFVFSHRQHGTNSLLGQKLSSWQGPALLCYNDATFSDRDFQNLASIGSASKLHRLSTTGRFGLGFNSVFHWTDVPSIVSGDYLVFFDPHARFVPGANASSRGIKIRFANSALKEEFPDQMEPLCMFGCDMKESFKGTLFRFPFRNEANAAASEISKTQFGKDGAVDGLLERFKEVLPRFLLFLRHVKRVEVHTEGNSESDPLRLLYFAEVSERKNVKGRTAGAGSVNASNLRSISTYRESNDGWNAVSEFVSGTPSHPLSKDDLYSLLLQTPREKLPRTKHLVTIVTSENADVDKDQYLVCTCLGGGNCLRMACDPKHRDMKFLPWAGVAAHIKRNMEDAPLTQGSAFCFLPLPTETGLPIHINGYFELSANRRDIWHGDDMAGAGKIRSDWNRALLTDAVAPLYAEMLLTAGRILGPINPYYRLWPVKTNGEVWKLVHDAVYSVAQDMPLFYSALDGGKWISPNSSVVIDGSDNRDASNRLIEVLLTERVNCVSLPSPIIKSLSNTSCQSKEVTPSMIRAWFKKPAQHDALNNRDDAIFVLKYCVEDLMGNKNFKELSGLPLLPLCNGRLGKIQHSDCSDFFVCTKNELELLSDASEYIVDVWTPDESINSILKSSVFLDETNVASLSRKDVVHLLSHSYPPEWSERQEVRWNPLSRDFPKISWLQRFWEYVTEDEKFEECGLELFVESWQILPTETGEGERTLLRLSHDVAVVSSIDPGTGSEMDAGVASVLRRIGVRTLDISIFSERSCRAVLQKLRSFIQAPTVFGVIRAIRNSFSTDVDNEDMTRRLALRFRGVSDDDKQKLKAFFSGTRNTEDTESLGPGDISLLRALPIYQLYGQNGDSTAPGQRLRFSHLLGIVSLPPLGADPLLLDHHFVHCSDDDANFFESLGVVRMKSSVFYEHFVCVRMSENGINACSESSVLKLLRDLPRLAEDDDGPQWISRLSAIAFLPNRSGELHRVPDLYDPTESDLVGLLDDSMLPSEKFCTASSLSSLRQLGLRSALNSDGVIECARSIEKLGASLLQQDNNEDPISELKKRSAALLNFLDKDETIENLLGLSGEGCDAEERKHSDPAPVDSSFATVLNEVSWLPVERYESAGLSTIGPPRKQRDGLSKVGIASPRATRPKQDEWICSGSMDILSTNIRSELLSKCFGWNSPVPVIVVASQILELSVMHESIAESRPFHQTLATVIPRCYDMLNMHLESADADERDRLSMLFHERPWLWVGDRFVTTSQVAFDAPDNARPFLFSVPNELRCFDNLLLCCGVRKRFCPSDFVALLATMKNQLRAHSPTQKQIDLAVFAARHLSHLPANELASVNKKEIFLLSKDESMYRATEMMYDDAPWLSAIVSQKARASRFVFVHPFITNDVAKKLGARSLRDVLSAHQNGMVKIPCPRSDALQQFLSQRTSENDSGYRAVLDLLEVAEMAGTKQVSISVDRRSHGSVSLLHPCLESAQGPAVVVCLHDVVLPVEDIIKLTSPSKFYLSSVSGHGGCGGAGFPRFGSGLCSAFSLTDCLQILSGSSMIFFDPCGQYFLDEGVKKQIREDGTVDDANEGESTSEFAEPDSKIEDHDEGAQVSSGSNRAGKGAKAIGRNYGISAEVLGQFPDQFAPFFSLPFGVEESLTRKFDPSTRPHFRGTILRMPLRAKGGPASFVSDRVFDDPEISGLLSDLEHIHASSFLFTYHLQSVTVGEWKPSHLSQKCVLNARVSSSPLARRSHVDDLRNNIDWKKSSSKFTKLFKSSWTAERSSYTVQISHRHGEDSNDVVDSYVIQTILAPPRLREMACTEALKPLNLLPAVSIAVHVHSTQEGKVLNAEFKPPKGTLCSGLCTGIETGLPFFLNAPLFLHELTGHVLLHKDDDKDLRKMFPGVRNVTVSGHGGEEVKTLALHVWNRQAITSALTCLIPSILRELRDPIRYMYSRDPRLLYKYWPYYSRISEPFRELLPDSVYQVLAKPDAAIYLTEKDGFKSVSEGYFASPDYPFERVAAAFFQERIPLFQVPREIATDLGRVGVETRQLTPRLARMMMKNGKQMLLLSHRPKEALGMLEYCLADMKDVETFEDGSAKIAKWRNELHGLCLVPLSDGSVGTIGRPLIIADMEQQQMLPSLRGKFISLTAIQCLDGFLKKPGFLALLGLTRFGPKVLASQISSVLPASWEGKDFVPFHYPLEEGSSAEEPVEGPSKLWIYQFWRQVPIWDQEALQMFRRWPLIPTTSGELASCANAKDILCFCPSGHDTALKEFLAAEHTSFKEKIEANAKREALRNAAETRETLSTDGERIDRSFWAMGSEDDTGVCNAEENGIDSVNEVESEPQPDVSNSTEEIAEEGPSSELPEPDQGQRANGHTIAENGVDAAGTPGSGHVDEGAFVHEANSPSIKSLFQILKKIRCPLLEPAFFFDDDLMKIMPLDRLNLTRCVFSTLSNSMDYWSASSLGEARLCWSSLEIDEYDQLIHLLSESGGVRLSLMQSDLNQLKRFPLYEALSGKRISLMDEHYTVEASIGPENLHYLPESLRSQLLVEKDRLRDLYEDMGIRSLNEGTLLQKFVLPQFHSLPLAQKDQVCQKILEKWQEVGSSNDFLEALKVTPFVKRLNPGCNEVAFVKPSQLLDPRNELVSFIFDDDRSHFPAEEFLAEEWLDILSEVGLNNVVDKEAFLQCAWKVEADQSVPKAMKLLAHYSENFGNFFDQDFGQQLASIKCVPGEIHGSPTSLFMFRDVAATKDRHVVFRVLPVIPENACPPQVMFSTFGIVSPPSISTVLQHLRSLTETSDALEHWNYTHGTVEEVFSHIFSFLQENYDRISPRVQGGLKEHPLVPVGSSLVKANRLFFRLKKDLSPFFYEVPRSFGAYDRLLRNIGVRDAPKGEDYALSLAELKNEAGNHALNVNELKSVIDVVSLVVDESQSSGSSLMRGLYVPDSQGILVPCSSVYQNDCPWLLNRLDLSRVHLAHPKLGRELCEQLHIGLLSNSIIERLEEGFTPTISNDADVSLDRIQRNIRSSHLMDTITQLSDIRQRGHVSALSDFSVVQVKRLRTVFALSNGAGSAGTNITLDPDGSYCFVHNRRFLVAELPAGLTIELVVAAAICGCFSVDRKHVAGLAAMLASDQASISAVGRSMGLCGADNTELRRGEPGYPMVDADLILVELKPLKVFSKGEVVAVRQDQGLSGKFVYAVVVESGGGSSLSRLRVRLGRDKVENLLSSEVFSIRSSGKEGMQPRQVQSSGLVQLDTATSSSDNSTLEALLVNDDQDTSDGAEAPVISPVDRNDILGAVQDLLQSAGMSLDDDVKNFMDSNLALKDQIAQKNELMGAIASEGKLLAKDLSKGLDAFLCPITREQMTDPVICADGHTYERHAIELWLRSSSRSPKTNQQLTSRMLIPNHAMRNAIDAMTENMKGIERFTETFE